MAKKKTFPAIKEKNQGKFSAWAKKNGFNDTCSAAAAVMKNPKKKIFIINHETSKFC
jgi:hypothetical protein